MRSGTTGRSGSAGARGSVLLFLLGCCFARPASPDAEPLVFGKHSDETSGAAVSLVPILANPGEFSGRRVMLVGFLNYDPYREEQELCLSREAYEYGVRGACLYFEPNHDVLGLTDSEIRNFSLEYIEVEGIIEPKLRGNWGLCPAGIRDVNRIFLHERSHRRARRMVEQTDDRPDKQP